MGRPRALKSIFDFDDPRDFLRVCFSERQNRNPKYSLRAFARDLDLDHAALLEKVLKKERKISADLALRLTLSLPFTPLEKRGFELLCLKATARSERESQLYRRLLDSARREAQGMPCDQPEEREIFIASRVEVRSERDKSLVRPEIELRHLSLRPSLGMTVEKYRRLGENFHCEGENRTLVKEDARHHLVARDEKSVGDLLAAGEWSWNASYFHVQYRDVANRPQWTLSGQDLFAVDRFRTFMHFQDSSGQRNGYFYWGTGDYITRTQYEDLMACSEPGHFLGVLASMERMSLW